MTNQQGQTANQQEQTASRVKLSILVKTALLCAFVTVATSVIRIPTPTFGYIHLGDAMVLLCAFLLDAPYAFFAAGIGSALSDLFGGYLAFVPATFLIKGAVALTAWFVYHKLKEKRLASIPAALLGEVVMVGGYFVFEIFLTAFGNGGFTSSTLYAGLLSSLSGVPFNLVQAATGIVLAALLLPVLKKISRASSKPV